MANAPTKAVVIGLDCCMPHLVEKHIAEGYLPNLKRLMERGVMADHCHPPFPTVTPPNWAAIATGAWAGTHGVTDFHHHEPGDSLSNDVIPRTGLPPAQGGVPLGSPWTRPQALRGS